MSSDLYADAPASALAVYAHPDDPEISAGGTLARWARAGAQIWLLVTTLGEKGSQDPGANLAELARVRAEETERSAQVLGLAGTYRFDHPDGELPDDDSLRADITRLVRELRPEVVLCPDPTAVFFGDQYYNHADHRTTGFATLDAIAPASGNPHYYPEHLADGLEIHKVHDVFLSGSLEPNCWVDVTDTMETKIDALFCHESQLTETGEWFREFLRERAEEAGREAGVTYAEGFRRLALSG